MAIPLSDLHVASEFVSPPIQNANRRPSIPSVSSMHDDRYNTLQFPRYRKALSIPLDAHQLAYLDRNPLPTLPLSAKVRQCCTRFTDKLPNHIPPQLLSSVWHVGTMSFRIPGVVVAFVGGVAMKGARWFIWNRLFAKKIVSWTTLLLLGSFYSSLDAGNLTTPTRNDGTGPLSGWTSACPPTFLHSDPDLILGGYSRVYPDLQQPWKDAYEGWNHFRKCWAGPSPHNHPNWSSLLAPGSQQLSEFQIRSQIFERGRYAWEILSQCHDFPCSAQYGETIDSRPLASAPWEPLRYEPPDDDLAMINRNRTCPPCRLRDHLSNAFSTSGFDLASLPASSEELETWCPCNFALAYRTTLHFLANLPFPYIHPFYSSHHSTLNKRSDILSVLIQSWNWLNKIRKGGRMPSQQEFVKAYAAGWWSYELSETHCSGKDCPFLDIHGIYHARGLRTRGGELCVPYWGSNAEDQERILENWARGWRSNDGS